MLKLIVVLIYAIIDELDKIIQDENLDKDKTYRFVEEAFQRGIVETEGTEISDLLPPMSRFSESGDRQAKKKTVITKILEFFDRFYVLTSTIFNQNPIEYGDIDKVAEDDENNNK